MFYFKKLLIYTQFLRRDNFIRTRLLESDTKSIQRKHGHKKKKKLISQNKKTNFLLLSMKSEEFSDVLFATQTVRFGIRFR